MSAEVVARLEAATEGSRELDLLVWQVVSGHPWRFICSTYGQQEVITWDRYGPSETGNPVVSLDHFTTSLDAALTLVPDGWGRRMGNGANGWAHPDKLETVSLFHPLHGSFDIEAPTLPIALCIAALLSREPRHD